MKRGDKLNFRDLRIRSGQSSKKIAHKLNIKEQTYLKYEYSMRLPSASILTQMKNVYQCTGNELLSAYNNHKEVYIRRYGKASS